MTLPATVFFKFKQSGGGWFFYYEGQEDNSTTDPKFTRDPDGNLFQTEVLYRVYAEHPDLEPDGELYRVYFDAFGIAHFADADINPPTTPGSNSGGNGTNVSLLALIDKATSVERKIALKELLKDLDYEGFQLVCAGLKDTDCGNTGGGGGGGSSSVAAAYAGCVNMPINNQRISLANAEDNKPIAHELGTAEFAATFYRLVNGTYRIDPNVGVSNPTETAFNLYSPESSFTGLVKLTRADAL